MGLDLSAWRISEPREAIWKDDPALGPIPDGVLQDWHQDGDAHHLRPYAKSGTPDVFTRRNLTVDEKMFIRSFVGEQGGLFRAYAWAFRIAVDFPAAPTTWADSRGVVHQKTEVGNGGIRMLSEPFCQMLEYKYPTLIVFYGSRIFGASFLTEAEKKASSPPPTPTQSSAEESTATASTAAAEQHQDA